MRRKKTTGKRFRSAAGLQQSEIEVEIDSLSHTGDGVARYDERVVFVAGTMPGDQVRAKVSADKRTFLQADVVDVLRPSADRIEAPCKYFGQCGGCDWQHIPYELQLKAKSSQITETLERIGGIADVTVLAIEPSMTPYHYRNRIQGQVVGGKYFQYRKNSRELVAVDFCKIADTRINAFIENKLVSVADGRVEIAVVDEQVEVLPIENRGTELGFRQVNSAVSSRLDELVLSAIAASGCNKVFDFYCGRGGWTNMIASAHPAITITGVDSTLVNVQAATHAAEQLKLNNVSYLHAKVEDSLSVMGSKNSLCIVDPPRSGLDPLVTQAFCKKPSSDLIYISCHPATLARDLKVLTQKAYGIKTVQPLDMFPQTSHIECLVHLQSGKASAGRR